MWQKLCFCLTYLPTLELFCCVPSCVNPESASFKRIRTHSRLCVCVCVCLSVPVKWHNNVGLISMIVSLMNHISTHVSALWLMPAIYFDMSVCEPYMTTRTVAIKKITTLPHHYPQLFVLIGDSVWPVLLVGEGPSIEALQVSIVIMAVQPQSTNFEWSWLAIGRACCQEDCLLYCIYFCLPKLWAGYRVVLQVHMGPPQCLLGHWIDCLRKIVEAILLIANTSSYHSCVVERQALISTKVDAAAVRPLRMDLPFSIFSIIFHLYFAAVYFQTGRQTLPFI